MTFTYRASELGGCFKMLLAQRQGIKPLDHAPDAMENIFGRGHRHESACIAVLEDQGYKVIDRQREVEVHGMPTGVRLVGHLDGMLVDDKAVISLPFPILELKSPKAYHGFIEEMYADEPGHITQRYKWQISCYMVATQREAVVATLDDQYNVLMHRLEIPFYDQDAIYSRVASLEEMATEPLPRLCSPREYPCKYVFLHEDDIVLDHDTEIDQLVTRYVNAKSAVDDAQKRQRHVLDLIRMAAGDRQKINTEHSSVSFYDRSYRKISKNKLQEAGIDYKDFEEVTVTKGIPRIVKKGGKGEEETTEEL